MPFQFVVLCAFRLAVQLNDALRLAEANLNDFEEVERRLNGLESCLTDLKPEVESFYVFAEDTDRTQTEFDVSSCGVRKGVSK